MNTELAPAPAAAVSSAPAPAPAVPAKRPMRFLTKIALAFGVALAGLIIFGLLSDRAEAAAKKAHTGAMMPYFQALHEGRLRDAWEKHTTPAYKAEFPLEKWEAAQKSRADWKPASEIAAPTAREASNLAIGGVQIKYYFTLRIPNDDCPVLIYDLVETPEGPRINRSYRMTFKSYVQKSGRKSAESENTPEPW